MLEHSDEFAFWGLGWIFTKVEDSHGRLAAWLVTLALTLGLVAGLIAIFVALTS
jgi:hypothetical protein